MSSPLPRFLLFPLILVLGGLVCLGVLYQQGYFKDPKVALRELKKQGVEANPASVHKATLQGQTSLLEVLKRAEVDLTAPNALGQNPLQLALLSGRQNLLEFFVTNGNDLNTSDQEGNTPLSIALDQSFQGAAATLIRAGAQPDFKLSSGELALIEYQKTGRLQDARFLLEHGANPHSTNLSGENILSLALRNKQADFACLLLDKGTSPESLVLGEPSLITFLKNYQEWGFSSTDATQVLTALLTAGADIEQVGKDGRRPLQIALNQNSQPALELLLPKTSDVTGCLWFAISHHNLAVIRTLLKKGAAVDPIGPQGDTPLVYAIRKGHADLVKLLLSFNANPHQMTAEGQRLVFLAIVSQHESSALAFFEHENRPDFHVIMESPVSKEFRNLFPKHKLLDWYCCNEKGLNPLMVAVMMGDLILTEKLIELGAPKFKYTKNRVYPIQMAAAQRDIKMQQLLIGVPYRDEEQKRKFIIDLSDQKVIYYKNGKIVKTSRISSGRSDFPTPPGQYVITDKTRDKKSNIYDEAEMPYFQRFSCTAIGFHEGNTSSQFASHGCIRLPRKVAQYFWKQTKLGDRVTIRK